MGIGDHIVCDELPDSALANVADIRGMIEGSS